MQPQRDDPWWCFPLGYRHARFQEEMSRRHGAEVAQWGYEPISRWRDFALSASGLIHVAASLHTGEQADPDAVHRAFSFWGLPDPPPASLHRPDFAWRLVADALSGWLSVGGVTIRAALRQDARGLSIGTSWVTGWQSQRHMGSVSMPGAAPMTGQVFGMLALQLMLRIGRNRDIGVCAWCRRPFLSADRRLRPDRRHFCEQCQREKRPDLMAQHDKRDRDRLRREGGDT